MVFLRVWPYFSLFQLYHLRLLMQGPEESPKAPLGNNARPIQPLHQRTIRTNINFGNSKVSSKSFRLLNHEYNFFGNKIWKRIRSIEIDLKYLLLAKSQNSQLPYSRKNKEFQGKNWKILSWVKWPSRLCDFTSCYFRKIFEIEHVAILWVIYLCSFIIINSNTS